MHVLLVLLWRNVKHAHFECLVSLCLSVWSKFCETEVVNVLEVEQLGRRPQQICTILFFLSPKNATSERPIALQPTLIRWWEWLRAPEVKMWQERHCVEWEGAMEVQIAPLGKPCS